MPSFLVLSDIHANLEALEAVLNHALEKHGYPDALWCLGDLVGYGPDPAACIDMLNGGHAITSRVPLVCIKGNHDEGTLSASVSATGGVSVSTDVHESWRWTYQELSPAQRDFLRALPETREIPRLPVSVFLVHASPRDHLSPYLMVPMDIEANMTAFEQRICLFGHTHLACYFECNSERREARPRRFPIDMQEKICLKGDKLFINPGSVGQPRWGYRDPLTGDYRGVREASYLWLDLDGNDCSVLCHFVPYKFGRTINKLDEITVFPIPDRWKRRLKDGLR